MKMKENAYYQIFPSVETIETWNSSGDQIILSLEATLQNKYNKNGFIIPVLLNDLASRTIPGLYGFNEWENLMVVIWSFITSFVGILQMGAELFKNLSTISTKLVLQVMDYGNTGCRVLKGGIQN